MYGVKVPMLAGFAVLPIASHNRLLFIAAVSMIATGMVFFVAGRIVARRAKSEAK